MLFSPASQDYRLYYSASSIHLNDSRIDEPLYLGLARADSPQGPWSRVSNQPLVLDNEDIGDKKVLGTGSLKFVKTAGYLEDDSRVTALSNRVTLDSQGRTGSTISLMDSEDGGMTWRTTIGDLISPQVDTPQSWKRSYVYGFDTLLGRTEPRSNIRIELTDNIQTQLTLPMSWFITTPETDGPWVLRPLVSADFSTHKHTELQPIIISSIVVHCSVVVVSNR